MSRRAFGRIERRFYCGEARAEVTVKAFPDGVPPEKLNPEHRRSPKKTERKTGETPLWFTGIYRYCLTSGFLCDMLS